MLVVYIVRMLDFINYCLSLTEFSTISEMALNILLLLCTMYPCEAVVSTLLIMKSKHQSAWKTLMMLCPAV